MFKGLFKKVVAIMWKEVKSQANQLNLASFIYFRSREGDPGGLFCFVKGFWFSCVMCQEKGV